MNTKNCNTEVEPAENKPANWSLDELNRRAGALVRGGGIRCAWRRRRRGDIVLRDEDRGSVVRIHQWSPLSTSQALLDQPQP